MKNFTTFMSVFIIASGLWATAYAETSEQPVVHFLTEDSSAYGVFSQVEFANNGSNNNAAGFLLGFGANQFRIGIDWVHAFDEQHRMNIALEHFSQNNDFNFTSGVDDKYVGQNAIGSTYQYLINNSRVKDINFTGYYAVAQNVSFTPLLYNNQLNIRDVTGANSGGLSMGSHLQLWRSGWLGLALNYDNVYFPMRYEAAKGSSGLGATASWIQLLSAKTALTLSAAPHEPYQLYKANLNWLAYQNTQGQLVLGAYGEHLYSRLLPVSSQNIIGLNLTYHWGDIIPQSAATAYDPVANDVLAWTDYLPSQLPGVFAARDQY